LKSNEEKIYFKDKKYLERLTKFLKDFGRRGLDFPK